MKAAGSFDWNRLLTLVVCIAAIGVMVHYSLTILSTFPQIMNEQEVLWLEQCEAVEDFNERILTERREGIEIEYQEPPSRTSVWVGFFLITWPSWAVLAGLTYGIWILLGVVHDMIFPPVYVVREARPDLNRGKHRFRGFRIRGVHYGTPDETSGSLGDGYDAPYPAWKRTWYANHHRSIILAAWMCRGQVDRITADDLEFVRRGGRPIEWRVNASRITRTVSTGFLSLDVGASCMEDRDIDLAAVDHRLETLLDDLSDTSEGAIGLNAQHIQSRHAQGRPVDPWRLTR